MVRCGIMGGTFDPIHLGHLVTAEAALHEYKLDLVYFVPSGQPPHKQDVTDCEHRYLMTLLATVANPKFFVSRVEIDREGYSYTFDTVEYFRRQYTKCEIYFITGADVMHDLHRWYRYRELLTCCHFVAATRPGFSFSDSKNLSPQDIACIDFLEVPSLAISSTDIRNRVRTQRPIKYLVPSSVEGYIYKHGLYRSKGEL
ncbi:MAG TPA: nicotinic acid mononucleotide adenylyltransferase [Firmicutes bacterium]|nr:nicotinic acid mononucleotide adenylyltransferase [Bacillota bacterium]